MPKIELSEGTMAGHTSVTASAGEGADPRCRMARAARRGPATAGDAGSFGAWLRACRVSAGLSQEGLAERSGLSVRAVGGLERGTTRWPHPGSVQRLAGALGLAGAVRAEFVAAAGRRLGPVVRGGGGEPAAGACGGYVVPRQLPGAVCGFAGRGDQLAELTRVLGRPGGPVIAAISGGAGVGKTAVAVAWAHRVAAEFPDGQLFVDLRGFGPGPPVTAAWAARVLLEALQVPAGRLPACLDAQLGLYRSLLAGKRALIVLDNARDAGQVRPLLPGSAACRVVVTSRNLLTSLVAAEAAHPLRLDALTDDEAGLLLGRRLGAARLAAEPDAAAQIIRSCAGMPLALCTTAALAATRPGASLAQLAADRGNPAADLPAILSQPAPRHHPARGCIVSAEGALTPCPFPRSRSSPTPTQVVGAR